MAFKFNGNIRVIGKVFLKMTPLPEPGNNPPVWVTEDGLLGIFEEFETINIQLEVTDPDNDIRTYAIVVGELPPGVNLNSTNGLISGEIVDITSDTEFNFTVRVTDSKGNYALRSFSMLVRDMGTRVTWITPEDLGDPAVGISYNKVLEARSS